MKIVFICLLAFSQSISAQVDTTFVRKGRVLIETGYDIFNFTSGTGATILFGGEDGSISSIGVEGGYFLSEDFALKLGVNTISVAKTIISIQLGGKYYINSVAPISINSGFITDFDDFDELVFVADMNIGYGISLAQNINLEPSIGYLVREQFDSGNWTVGLNFAMFL